MTAAFGCFLILLVRAAEASEFPAAEALRQAERLVLRPTEGLDRLELRLLVAARSPELGENRAKLRFSYELGFDLTVAPREGGHTVRTIAAAHLSNGAAPSQLNELLGSYLIPLFPLPEVSGWVGQLREVGTEGSLRKLRFEGRQQVRGGWVAPVVASSVLWLDEKGLCVRHEFEVRQSRTVRLEYGWGLSRIPGRYRLERLVQTMNYSPGSIQRREFAIEYVERDARELPSRMIARSFPPSGESPWELEFLFEEYRLRAADGSRPPEAVSSEKELLRAAENRLTHVSKTASSVECRVEMDIENAAAVLPVAEGVTLRAAIFFRLDFQEGSEGFTRGTQLLSLEALDGSSEISPAAIEGFLHERPKQLEKIFDPVAELPGAFRRVDDVRKEGDLTRYTLANLDLGQKIPTEIWVTPDAEIHSVRVEALDGTRRRLYDEWQEDPLSGELAIRRFRIEAAEKSWRDKTVPLTSAFDISYRKEQGILVPSSAMIRLVPPFEEAPVIIGVRFSDYKIVRREATKPLASEAGEKLANLRGRLYRLMNHVRGLGCQARLRASGLPESPWLPSGGALEASFRVSVEFNRGGEAFDSVRESILEEVSRSGSPLVPPSEFRAHLEKETRQMLQTAFDPVSGIFDSALAAVRGGSPTAIVLGSVEGGSGDSAIFTVDESGKLLSRTIRQGQNQEIFRYRWEENPATRELRLVSLEIERASGAEQWGFRYAEHEGVAVPVEIRVERKTGRGPREQILEFSEYEFLR